MQTFFLGGVVAASLAVTALANSFVDAPYSLVVTATAEDNALGTKDMHGRASLTIIVTTMGESFI